MAPDSAALVVGVGGGIGAEFATALAERSGALYAWARRPLVGRPGWTCDVVDLTDEGSIAQAAARLKPDPPLRLVVIATGLLHDGNLQPEKSLAKLDPAQLARSFAVNAIGPALIAKHVIPRLPREGRTVFAALSARVGSIGDNRLGGWYGYRASKAALNQILRTAAIEARRSRPETIIVALHPGTVATRLSAPFRGTVDPDRLLEPAQAAARLLHVIESLTPDDSGMFFDWNGSPVPF